MHRWFKQAGCCLAATHVMLRTSSTSPSPSPHPPPTPRTFLPVAMRPAKTRPNAKKRPLSGAGIILDTYIMRGPSGSQLRMAVAYTSSRGPAVQGRYSGGTGEGVRECWAGAGGDGAAAVEGRGG